MSELFAQDVAFGANQHRCLENIHGPIEEHHKRTKEDFERQKGYHETAAKALGEKLQRLMLERQSVFERGGDVGEWEKQCREKEIELGLQEQKRLEKKERNRRQEAANHWEEVEK